MTDGFEGNEFVQYRGSQDKTVTDFSIAPQAGIRTGEWMLTRNVERPADYSGPTFFSQAYNGNRLPWHNLS
jgi:hypothetical protein